MQNLEKGRINVLLKSLAFHCTSGALRNDMGGTN